MRRIAVFVAVIAACLWCRASASVPLTVIVDGHFVVPAYVNGQGPYRFILDTGADGSGVYRWFAGKMHLPVAGAIQLSGMTGTTASLSFRMRTLSIDGRTIRNVTADGFPDRHDRGNEAGVAGNDLMDGTLTVFDFPCNRVDMHEKPVAVASLLPEGGAELHGGSVIDGTQLTFPVRVNGVVGIAVLDTGSRDTKISPQFATAAGVDVSSPAFHTADVIYGANSHGVASRKGPVASVAFAGFRIRNPQIRVIDLPVFRSFGLTSNAMILGTDLMAHYRLVYDHEARRFWFGRSPCAP